MKKPASKQSGSILLALMLIMVVAASFTLVSKLNASSRTFIRKQSTMETLQRAKAALIAYAVTYPEQSGTTDPAAGPGYMPCPDTDFPPDGSPNPFISNCNESIDRYAGRFPGEFLGVGNYVDDSGARIWYAISDNFRNIGGKFSPINSDTAGGLSIDTDNDGVGDITDIVAILIAPGLPVDTIAQNRPSNLITDYLEGENTDGDTVFAQNSGGGNDTLVYITKQELMRAVEKRVSGDVVNALKSYQADTGVFPWLTPFDPSPATVDYDADAGPPGTSEGSLAFNAVNEVFSSQFSVGWDFRSGGNGAPYALTPTATMPDWNSFGPPITPSPIKVDTASLFYNLDGNNGPACRWISRDAINCVGRAQDPAPVTLRVSLWGIPLVSVTGTRYYDFNVIIPSNGTASVCGYTLCANSVRNRDVNLAADPATFPATGFPAGTQAQVTVTDAGTINGCINPFGFGCWPLTAPIVITPAGQVPVSACVNTGFFGIWCLPLVVINGGSTTNTITTATDADIDVYETTYDLGEGDELPQWFTANNWHKFIYTAYSKSDVPDPAAMRPCGSAGAPACLTLVNTGLVSNNKQAVIVMAGSVLTGQDRVTPPLLISNFFENTNNIANDDIFVSAPVTATFNDLARAVAP